MHSVPRRPKKQRRLDRAIEQPWQRAGSRAPGTASVLLSEQQRRRTLHRPPRIRPTARIPCKVPGRAPPSSSGPTSLPGASRGVTPGRPCRRAAPNWAAAEDENGGGRRHAPSGSHAEPLRQPPGHHVPPGRDARPWLAQLQPTSCESPDASLLMALATSSEQIENLIKHTARQDSFIL